MYELYLGPMTKNIVDGVISFTEKSGISLGLIASRRQIDYLSGYVNKWDTRSFTRYVESRSNNVVICRDHGGIGQGSFDDDGVDSLMVDAECMYVIHIDPWKKLRGDKAIEYTADMIRKCAGISKFCMFEVGTEESILPMRSVDLDYVLSTLESKIPKLFSRILYAVIQSGTSLKNGTNTGRYDEERLLYMVEVCSNHGVLSKEHNGDYLSVEKLGRKLRTGLSAINIAPEVAHIESIRVLQSIAENKKDQWFDLCMKDGQWKKWFSSDFDPTADKSKVLKLCGHYVFSHEEFKDVFDLDTVSEIVSEDLHTFISERLPYGH